MQTSTVARPTPLDSPRSRAFRLIFALGTEMSDFLEDPMGSTSDLTRPSWETTPDEVDVAFGGAGIRPDPGRGRIGLAGVRPAWVDPLDLALRESELVRFHATATRACRSSQGLPNTSARHAIEPWAWLSDDAMMSTDQTVMGVLEVVGAATAPSRADRASGWPGAAQICVSPVLGRIYDPGPWPDERPGSAA
jgi:hypothetical protein